MKKRLNKYIAIILCFTIIFSFSFNTFAATTFSNNTCRPNTTIIETKNFKVQKTGSRTMIICKRCYEYNAKLVCNHDTIFSGTYTHGNCTSILYKSTVNYVCPSCGANERVDNGLHDCVISHTGCGLGQVSICGVE